MRDAYSQNSTKPAFRAGVSAQPTFSPPSPAPPALAPRPPGPPLSAPPQPHPLLQTCPLPCAPQVVQLLRDYLQDNSTAVQVTDFCASNRTFASFTVGRTVYNGTWPILLVNVALHTPLPHMLPGITSSLGRLTNNW
ncbi:hypothetical protein HaLaN_09315 [Haematococcus lacustris]|uniref:Uncharacterized protein n=1 Tax=Haematococcus lacustris TaxID=44745 RepID=A0A699YUD8_HAELA|nr:hypothetical protein HaLaN_09315 [Haematococcus lacustris]